MTEHDQKVCLRCSASAGDHSFCEPCRLELDGSAGCVTQAAGHAARAYAAAPPADIRFEQSSGATDATSGPDAGEGAATIRIDASARPGGDVPDDTRSGAVRLDGVASTGGERLSKSSPQPREVARFEELLSPAVPARSEVVEAPAQADRTPELSDIEAALAEYREADAAGSPEGSTNLGVWLEENGDIEGALAAYRRAGERGNVDGMFNLGCLLAEVGDLAGALSAFQQADDRGDPGAASNLGVLLERHGDAEGALAAYRRADKRGDAAGAFNLGRLLAGQGELAEAKAAYRRAATRDDSDVRRQAVQAEANLAQPGGGTAHPSKTGSRFAPEPEPRTTNQPSGDAPPEIRPGSDAGVARTSVAPPGKPPTDPRTSIAPPSSRGAGDVSPLASPRLNVAPLSPWVAALWGLALLGVFVLLVRRHRRRRR